MSSDARFVGPMTYCPMCQGRQAWAVVQVCEDTLELEMYGLEVRCFACDTLYRMACPADVVLRETTEPPASAGGPS